MTVDNHIGSPFQDRIYVTWTEFANDGSAYIWESYSSDYGENFSTRHLVSINAPTLCANTFRRLSVGEPEGRRRYFTAGVIGAGAVDSATMASSTRSSARSVARAPFSMLSSAR